MLSSAVLLAAGNGTRYGETKQFVCFHGKPLWECVYDTLNAVLPSDRIIVAGVDLPGGATRSGSVTIGLNALPADTDRVIIAEAARPLLTVEQVIELLDDPYPSSSFAIPLVNTVAYWDGRYINREELCEVLVPQAFDYKLLVEAYRSGRFTNMTDETRVMFEYHGIKPHYLDTRRNLSKVTYPGDLDKIEILWQKMQTGEI